MKTPRIRRGLRPVLCASASLALLCSSLHAQSATTAGVSGSVAGAPAGVTVTAVHVPTGTVYTAVTRPGGVFDFRGMIPGGPYTVKAAPEGAAPLVQNDLYTNLGEVTEISLAKQGEAGEVVVLDEVQVTAGTNDLDGGSLGAGSIINSERIGLKPTTERSLADVVSGSAFVTTRSFGGDRGESQITALGQNNRFNSIQIDGARINDQFGLNGTGLASFFNPLSLDTVEQISVQVSPYDVRDAGFTGASINAVTKSGTNQFKGSVYYYWQGDELLGVRMRGENPREDAVSNVQIYPKLDRSTLGATFGGPILKNKLFFFGSYEKFESTSAGRDKRLISNQEQQILDRLVQYGNASGKTYDWGNLITNATTNLAEDEKIIGKLDWNISDNHRAWFRFSRTEGTVPQFGRYATATLNNYLGLSGGPVGGVDGHFYAQQREETSYAAQISSQWTPDLKTEIRYSRTEQTQATPVGTVAPEIAIYGLTGTDTTTGRTVTNGVFVAGTEQFRQGNAIEVETDQITGTADYFWNDFVFTTGYQREQSDFYNLFRQSSFGLIGFRSVADFLNDRPARIDRNFFDPALRPGADISEFATNGVFLQSKWNLNRRLNVVGGVRFEWNEQPIAPAFNQAFLTATGFRNDGTLDGANYVSPRIGFNWALDDDRVTQIRGGIGHFTGRTPWVFFSNSYNNIGVGSFTTINSSPAQGAFSQYLANFDPANPFGTGTDTPGARREINWADGDIKLPSVWRASLGADRKIGFLDTVLSVETVFTKNIDPIFISNENLRRVNSPAADGRFRFAGNPQTQANALYAGYTDLYRIRNVDGGDSWYTTITWERPMKDDWAFGAQFSIGESNEVQAIGQTTASGQWQRNVVFNQGEVEEGTSDFEIKNRLQLSLSRRFNFVKKAPTTVSLYYEGRTGNPYSFVYNTDINGDGRNDNDLMAVPSGANDARFDFSQMNQTQVNTYFANLEAAGLMKFAGGIAKKNAFEEPWMNRLDLKFVQEIPIYSPAKLELFFDFINFGAFISRDLFGYFEEASLRSNEVFRTRQLGGASYGPDGRIRPTVGVPANFEIDNDESRWRIQLGAKLSF